MYLPPNSKQPQNRNLLQRMLGGLGNLYQGFDSRVFDGALPGGGLNEDQRIIKKKVGSARTPLDGDGGPSVEEKRAGLFGEDEETSTPAPAAQGGSRASPDVEAQIAAGAEAGLGNPDNSRRAPSQDQWPSLDQIAPMPEQQGQSYRTPRANGYVEGQVSAGLEQALGDPNAQSGGGNLVEMAARRVPNSIAPMQIPGQQNASPGQQAAQSYQQTLDATQMPANSAMDQAQAERAMRAVIDSGLNPSPDVIEEVMRMVAETGATPEMAAGVIASMRSAR
jgi:hypothetical protein